MLSQGDSTGDLDLLTLMKEYIKVTYDKPGNVYLGLVHRLDRPVGGVMVFAKTSKAAARLSKQIQEGNMGRRYLAVVEGIPSPLQGTLEDHLLKDRKSNLVKVVPKGTPGAKRASLSYEVVGFKYEYLSWATLVGLIRLWCSWLMPVFHLWAMSATADVPGGNFRSPYGPLNCS